MDDPADRVALKDLAVVCAADERPHAIGAFYNPLGMAAWTNTAGMALVLVSKRYLLVGQLVARALRVRGLLHAEHREDFYEHSGDVPSTLGYFAESVRLLLAGKPFESLNRPVIFRPRARGEEFYLVHRA